MENAKQGTRFNPFLLLFGVISFTFFTRTSTRDERGRDVSFDLPLRFCSKYAATCRGKELRHKLEQVEEYRRLFEKYPHAKIGQPIPVSST